MDNQDLIETIKIDIKHKMYDIEQIRGDIEHWTGLIRFAQKEEAIMIEQLSKLDIELRRLEDLK